MKLKTKYLCKADEIIRQYCQYLTTISTELKTLWEFCLQKLKTCSLYHENLFIQKVKVISTQVFNNFISASDTMEAVRGRFHFYGKNYKGCLIQVVLLQSLIYLSFLLKEAVI